ncbi:hypothetical protein MTX78_09380 [Hymenobacter tibetensis]|uniref:Uncharacterized protein n=1 Tax=Hymenobacter tibetensis TaxID=497967 RepID=A0ABY4D446_9BACT|nr:hypothetical protein [Hymenobacter tibetensis]UOG76797.1 hypothetical protein MTX78_09380 [Hymenobacter tibetensis]
MNTSSISSSQGTEINWNVFTSVNQLFVLAHPTGFYLLSSTLNTVWTPVVGQA